MDKEHSVSLVIKPSGLIFLTKGVVIGRSRVGDTKFDWLLNLKRRLVS